MEPPIDAASEPPGDSDGVTDATGAQFEPLTEGVVASFASDTETAAVVGYVPFVGGK
jgi:hypothetical protein